MSDVAADRSSPRSSRSSTSPSSSSIEYDFSIELDKTISSTLWIEFMEWSKNMDVIALIMHQTSNNNQHLWLQRCVGKWQNLLNVDLSQELDDGQRVISIAWRYDGNGVCLGLSNGEMIQFLIENSGNKKNNILKSELHNASINNIQWIMHKNDEENDDDVNENTQNNKNGQRNKENRLNELNEIMQNNEDLLSCTQLNPTEYEKENNEKLLSTNNHLLSSLSFSDQTNKFLSKIPSLPKPPRIDFRYNIHPKQNTLQYIMKMNKTTSAPPIPRKSQPITLPLLVTSDNTEIQIHCSGQLCIAKINLNALKPSKKKLKEVRDQNENKSNGDFVINHIDLCTDLQCINSIISDTKTNNLYLRFIHCPILYSRRNELLIISNHSEYIEMLLDQLNKLDRHLLSRWAMGIRSIKGKITPLQEILETFNSHNTWQHELKHNLMTGHASPAFVQFVGQNLNVTALERGYKQFDQFVNEMVEIVQKNLMHIIQELIFRCSELKGYALWKERFGCFGISETKLSAFIEKLSALYLKLDQLQILIADSKLNLIAFKDYLLFLSSIHNNEDNAFKEGFDKLDVRRIFACIDYDLQPNRVQSFLTNALLAKKDLILFSLRNQNKDEQNENVLFAQLKKKWKRFDRFSFSYLVQDVRRSWKAILNVLPSSMNNAFEVNEDEYGLLYLSNGSNKEKMSFLYHVIDCKKDIDFVTTDCFSNIFGVDCDINLCAINAMRSSMKNGQKCSKIMLVAIIPQIENTQSKVICSEDIWTENFEKFEQIIGVFPAKASINDVKICVIDILPYVQDEDEEKEGMGMYNFESMEIVQIKFVGCNRLAVLAKFGYKSQKSASCLLTIDLKKIEIEFQGNMRLNDYEMGLNEMAFDFGMISNRINVNDLNKYLFSSDVDARSLAVCGRRKLAAVSCDPSSDDKCNRLIVLDINCDGQESEDEDESDESETNNDREDMMSTSDNEDSDLKNVIDID